jgi:hypothetical protein
MSFLKLKSITFSSTKYPSSSLIAPVLSLGSLGILLGISSGAWRLWSVTGPIISPAGRFTALLGGILITLGMLYSFVIERRLPKCRDFAHYATWTTGLIAVFASDWIVRPWSLYQGPTIRGELFLGVLLSYYFLKSTWRQYANVLPILSVGLLIWSFTLEADRRLLFSDDHAMFLFRLKMLVENFPNIPFWSPLWNSGFDARDYFATGALNFFLIFSPALYAFSVEQVYPYLIAILLWIFLPCSIYVSSRLLHYPKTYGFIASTVALSTGLFWYRWALKYGTLGFITSSILLPIVVILWHTFIKEKSPSLRTRFSLILATTLMCLWSPSALATLPIGFFVILALPRLIVSKKHILTALILVAINLPWMCMMWKVSSVGKFLNTEQAHISSSTTDHRSMTSGEETLKPKRSTYRHRSDSLNLKDALNQWHKNVHALNPILVILGIPSILLLARKERLLFGTLVAWMLFLGTILVPIKPQLELDRMIVMASVLTCIPVGRAITILFLKASRSSFHRLAGAIVGGFLVIAPFTTSAIVLNRSDETYSFLSPSSEKLIHAIKAHASNGRVFFTGCVLHELDGGHLAPLPLWTDTEMIATSYAHNIWNYTQPFPKDVIEGGIPAIEAYLHSRNVSLITAHEPVWLSFLKKNKKLYKRIGEHGKFVLFKRTSYTPNLIVAGGVKDIIRSTNAISFTPTTSSVTLNYSYYPFLEASSGRITAVPSTYGETYISVSGYSPGERITIQSTAPLKRLMM